MSVHLTPATGADRIAALLEQHRLQLTALAEDAQRTARGARTVEAEHRKTAADLSGVVKQLTDQLTEAGARLAAAERKAGEHAATASHHEQEAQRAHAALAGLKDAVARAAGLQAGPPPPGRAKRYCNGCGTFFRDMTAVEREVLASGGDLTDDTRAECPTCSPGGPRCRCNEGVTPDECAVHGVPRPANVEPDPSGPAEVPDGNRKGARS